MSNPLPNPVVRSCPGCGAALNSGAVTCQSCGGIVAVEGFLSKLKAELRFQMTGVGMRLRDRSLLLWVLALCPILILPPLLAIVMSFRAPRTGDGSAQDGSAQPDFLVILAAVCNIILSVMFWRWLSHVSLSMGFSVLPFFRAIGITSSPGTQI